MLAARNIRNLVFIYFSIFFIFSIANLYLGRVLDNNLYLIIVSIASQVITITMVALMFKTTKVKGTDRTYELGPDLGIRKEIIQEKQKLPEEAPCAQCQRIVYKPFQCSDCKQLFCGQHSLD